MDSEPPKQTPTLRGPLTVACLVLAPATVFAQELVLSPALPPAPPPGMFPYLGFVALSLTVATILTAGQTAVAAGSGLGTPQSQERLSVVEQRCSAGAAFLLLFSALLLARFGQLISPDHATLGAVLGALLGAILQIVLTECFARMIALVRPEPAFRWLLRPVSILSLPFHPLLIPAQIFGAYSRPKEAPGGLAEMHLRLLPAVSGVARVIEEEAFEMIDSVREFAETTGDEIMTPRTEVEGIPDDLSASEIYGKLRESMYSRLVVYTGSMDHIVGTLLVKEVLLRRPEDPLSLLRKPHFVPENTRAPELLAIIRANRSHLLVLQDEYGGVSGVVTLHDLFEALIGDIEESEDDEDELWINEVGDGRYLVNGRVAIWDLNEELGTNLPEEIARTVGGYVFHTLGRLAVVDDEVEFEGGKLHVMKVGENRIEQLEVILPVQPEAPAAEDTRGSSI